MMTAYEWVSPGHPDKICDAIAGYILDRYIMVDPDVRFALEVQLKDNICNLAGEVTSTCKFSEQEIAEMVREAVRKIGYTSEYAAKWPENVTLNANDIIVNNYIGVQSPDIAMGVDNQGWGDQGVFMGMAKYDINTSLLPLDVCLGREIGRLLYAHALNEQCPFGLDIKVLVSIDENRNVDKVIVAAPMKDNEKDAVSMINEIVRDVIEDHINSCDPPEIIINGTGSYVVHSSVGDAGVVGRKLAVDFYGLNCPIGGGAPHGKDPSKADVSLNLLARYIATRMAITRRENIFVKMACCIGRPEVQISVMDDAMSCIGERTYLLPVKKVVDEILNIRRPIYFKMATEGIIHIADSEWRRFNPLDATMQGILN